MLALWRRENHFLLLNSGLLTKQWWTSEPCGKRVQETQTVLSEDGTTFFPLLCSCPFCLLLEISFHVCVYMCRVTLRGQKKVSESLDLVVVSHNWEPNSVLCKDTKHFELVNSLLIPFSFTLGTCVYVGLVFGCVWVRVYTGARTHIRRCMCIQVPVHLCARSMWRPEVGTNVFLNCSACSFYFLFLVPGNSLFGVENLTSPGNLKAHKQLAFDPRLNPSSTQCWPLRSPGALGNEHALVVCVRHV